MVYDRIIQNEQELDDDIEKDVVVEYRDIRYEGQQMRLGMTKRAWPQFLALLEQEQAALSEIERVALACMRDFPLRGYQTNFSEAVYMFYEHRISK